MRQVKDQQFQLGEMPLAQIKFDPRSRDDIPQLLKGLQYVYLTPEIRQQVFGILEAMVPQGVNRENGRPGMGLWKILVMGTLRLNLDWDYDRLHEMVNHHRTIRQMLGHGLADDEYMYNLQTLKDNVVYLTVEILDKINRVVVSAGHTVLKKKDGVLRGKCDSFVVETDVHYPTDINLLYDAIRKTVTLIAGLCEERNLPGYRQYAYNIRRIKRLYRKAQQSKRSTSNDAGKKEKQDKAILSAHQDYLEAVSLYLERVNQTLTTISAQGVEPGELAEIEGYMAHARRQMDQVKRRVVNREEIPHAEKVFSLFEPHTEWISKGKAGVPVELGLKVCVMEDQYGFILHHRVMQKETDEQVAVAMVKETQARFPSLKICSYDKGFHSPANQQELKGLLDLPVLPRKGRLSREMQEFECSEPFATLRRKHSAVESGINALEVHGLDICPDHGINGFERYVALAVTARNVQKLGAIIQKQEARRKKLSELRKKAA